ncbi:MAG: type II toxin-antitoxin system VapC family toxin, partial [Flammeovirgaceae bacterium]
MTEFETIFIDTSPFIYLIEKYPVFGDSVEKFLSEQFSDEAKFYTSVISVSEFQVGPKRTNQLQAIADFNELIDKFNFSIFNITYETADVASSMRAKYPFLKGLDSLQIASTINSGCKSFFTNDSQLKKI